MKNLISVVFALLFTAGLVSAQVAIKSYEIVTPKTLTAGTAMSARTASVSMDDTTQAFSARGLQAIYVGLESATNDTVKVYVSYQISKDGTTFGALALVDSLSSTGIVGVSNYIALPAKVLASPYARVRVYGITANGAVSINPSPTVSTSLVRVFTSAVKQN